MIIFGIVAFGVVFDTGSFFTDTMLLEFSFGIFIYYILTLFEVKKWLGMVCIFSSFIVYYLVSYIGLEELRVLKFGVPAGLFFIGMVILEPVFINNRTILISKIAKAVGDSSYSLYLFHAFSHGIFAVILVRVGASEFGGIFVALLVLSAIISGHLCYLLLEVPLTRAIKNVIKYVSRTYRA